jgi:hypothetical protein
VRRNPDVQGEDPSGAFDHPMGPKIESAKERKNNKRDTHTQKERKKERERERERNDLD